MENVDNRLELRGYGLRKQIPSREIFVTDLAPGSYQIIIFPFETQLKLHINIEKGIRGSIQIENPSNIDCYKFNSHKNEIVFHGTHVCLDARKQSFESFCIDLLPSKIVKRGQKARFCFIETSTRPYRINRGSRSPVGYFHLFKGKHGGDANVYIPSSSKSTLSTGTDRYGRCTLKRRSIPSVVLSATKVTVVNSFKNTIVLPGLTAIRPSKSATIRLPNNCTEAYQIYISKVGLVGIFYFDGQSLYVPPRYEARLKVSEHTLTFKM